MIEHIKKAVAILDRGGIVIFPTDTAFGIGCRIDRQAAIDKLYSIRRRPPTQAMSLLCNSIDMAEKYVISIPQKVRKDLMAEFWPGALTIVLSANMGKVPDLVRGGGLSAGVRIPDHDVPIKMITASGVPILGPSANFHGEPTPYKFSDINPGLISLADYVVPGVCTIRRESTVIDCTENKWRVLRKGAVTIEV